MLKINDLAGKSIFTAMSSIIYAKYAENRMIKWWKYVIDEKIQVSAPQNLLDLIQLVQSLHRGEVINIGSDDLFLDLA